MMMRIYAQLDHATLQWKETLKEVERLGEQFWEVREPSSASPEWARSPRTSLARSSKCRNASTLNIKLCKYSEPGHHRSHQRR